MRKEIEKKENRKMLKKVIGSALLIGLIGVLAFGAINRVQNKTTQAQGRGSGAGRSLEQANARDGQGYGANRASGETNGRDAQGQGQGGARAGAAQRQYPNYETPPETWETHTGNVVQAPGNGEELVIQTGAGQELIIGTGPLDWAAQGFALQAGEQVQVQGYWEDGEFKATQLTRLADGQTLVLRDAYGQPAWAGAGRSVQGEGSGQAQASTWLPVQGHVVSVDAVALVVQTTDGEQVSVQGQPWRYAQAQGFVAQVGDPITLSGFYVGNELEVGQMDNTTNGQTVLLRDESGRPLWSGGGRRGS
jgi:hypothetical protein